MSLTSSLASTAPMSSMKLERSVGDLEASGLHSGLFQSLTVVWCSYTECMGVPQCLCQRSMAFVTIASVFSCGILDRKLKTPSG